MVNDILISCGCQILLQQWQPQRLPSFERAAGPSSTIGCRQGPGALTSTPDALQAFEEASGKTVKYKLVPRRQGDSVAVWAATETAEQQLGWKTKLGVDDMCRDQWKWASQYPKGYEV